MKRIILPWIALSMMSAVPAAAENTLQLSIAPEVWYAKWNPGFIPAEEASLNASRAAYDIKPAILYGVSLSALYGSWGLTGEYFTSKSEKNIHSKAGIKDDPVLEDELKCEVLGHLGGMWYLKDKVSSGKFAGNALGVSWERGVSPESAKSLSVDTNWFQGDIAALIKTEKGPKDLAVIVGYRYESFRIPFQSETFDVDGLVRKDFVDTGFTTQALFLGVEELPGTHLGWHVAITRFVVGFGQTRSNSSAGSASTTNQGFGKLLEGDLTAVYSSSHFDFNLGMRYSSYKAVMGKGGLGDAYTYTPGIKLTLNEVYVGPYVRAVLHF